MVIRMHRQAFAASAVWRTWSKTLSMRPRGGLPREGRIVELNECVEWLKNGDEVERTGA